MTVTSGKEKRIVIVTIVVVFCFLDHYLKKDDNKRIVSCAVIIYRVSSFFRCLFLSFSKIVTVPAVGMCL